MPINPKKLPFHRTPWGIALAIALAIGLMAFMVVVQAIWWGFLPWFQRP